MTSIFDRFAEEEKTTQGFEVFEKFSQEDEDRKKGISKEKIEEGLTDVGQQTGRKFLSSAVASPKLFAELLSTGSKYLAEKGAEGKGEIDPFTQKVLKVMGFPEAVLERIGYPDQDRFEEMIMALGEKTGAEQLSKEPKTALGRRGAKIGEFAGTAALGGPKNFAERLLFGALGGEGAAEAEELGGGPGSQIGSAIALPTAIQLFSSIKSGKFKPNTEEAEQLAKFFRQLGMTEEEIVPLLQPSGKQKALGKIAKSDEKLEGIIGKKGTVEQKLGEGYEQLKRESKELPRASQQQVEKLIGEFQDIGDNLRKSVMPSDEKLSALKKIDKAVEELWQNGITPEGIIETTIDINDAVNWNSYKQGKKDLAKLKKPLKELYKQISPEGAATFEKLNEGWSRLKSIQKNIGENNFKSMINYGKGIAYLGSAVKNIATGNVKGLIATGTTALGVEMSQLLAKKMLTDPKYQNILLKSATAIKKGSRAQALKAYDELVSQTLKDFPKESKNVDWEKLKNKSSKKEDTKKSY